MEIGESTKLVVCLDLAEEKFRVLKKGRVVQYTLRELTGIQRDLWINKAVAAGEAADGEKKTRDFSNLQASLIAACVYDENDKPFTVDEVAEWPASTQKKLFDKCQEMNGLDDKAEDRGKNS